MLFGHVFVAFFLILHTGTLGRKNILNPCNDKRLVLETSLVKNTIENKFRLGCTSTLFTMSGGSSSVTWYAKQPLVSEVWTEFYFFYEQAIVLRFIRILLGFEPTAMSLTCVFDLASKKYSFFLRVDKTFIGVCTSNKTSYICSAGRMTEFFKNLEHYKDGKSIVTDLKKHVKSIQKKWLHVCRLFERLERNVTHVYSVYYDHITNVIRCSIESSVPWRYDIFINGSIINDTETKYDRIVDMHMTVGSVPRGDGLHFVCVIVSPYGKSVSQIFDVSEFTTSTIATFPIKEYWKTSTTFSTYNIITTRELVKTDILIQYRSSVFGVGPIVSIVIIVVLVIILIGSFVFREEIISFKHQFQKVPTESPYKDIVMTIGK